MRLPSLNALRAFEAAVRLGSISKAADELSVTPGAVSHQIKLLEADLGVPLLVREGRGLSPTTEARAGLEALREGFAGMATAVAAIRQAGRQPRLNISVAISFASSWLVPRLDRFLAREPNVDVRIDVKWTKTDFEHDDIDLVIRFGPGGYPGFYEHRLLDEDYFPVCSPALVQGPKPLRTPTDLRHHVLLHIDADYLGPEFPTWRMWLKAAGVDAEVDCRRGPHFHVSDHALKAAREGQGVALGSSALVGDDIRRGHLVRPFPQSLVAPFAYHVVCPHRHLERPVVQNLVAWLKEEAAAFSQATP